MSDDNADEQLYVQRRSTEFPRRYLFKAGGTALSALALGSLLNACGGGTGDAKSSAAAATGSGAAAGGGSTSSTLTVAVYQEPDTLDPNVSGQQMVKFIMGAVYEPLMWWLPGKDGENKFEAGLATSYQVSADATSYTFKLRTGVTFHDGTAFGPDAVKATFDHIVDPAAKSRTALGSLGPYKETRIVDDHTVTIVFKEPNAAFIHEMACIKFGITSPAALKKYGATGLGNHPVGTGPFKFVSYTPQDSVVVERNDAYAWGPASFGASGPAKLQRIEFKILPDASARFNALQAGQADVAMQLDPSNMATLESDQKYQNINVPSTGLPYSFPINVKKKPTDQLEVRQAILYAVDQDALTKTILQGVFDAAHSVVTPTTPGYTAASANTYKYNPAKAQQLLEGAGWKVGSGGVRYKDGQELSLEILLLADNGFELPAQYVATQLKQVGFNAKITSQPFAAAAASANKGDQNLASIFFYDVDPYLLLSMTGCDAIASGYNWEHWCDPANDSAIKKANTLVDEKARDKAYSDIIEHIASQAIYLPLWNTSGVFSIVKSLSGLHYSPTGFLLFHTAALG